MNATFGEINRLLLKPHHKKNTSVLALIMFHETIGKKPRKAFRLLSCVIYTIIENYVCIDYLACQ